MSVLRIHCLGQFQVFWSEKLVSHFETVKNRALLAYLALEGGSALSRDFMAGLLWPDFPNAIALRNLRLALFNLRQVLSDQAELPFGVAEVPVPIVSSRLAIQFDRSAPVWVDAKEFEDLFAQTRKHPHSSLQDCALCIEKLERAVAYYQGDFLDGLFLKDADGFMEWLMLRRAHFQQLMLDGLDQLSRFYLHQAEQAVSEVSFKQGVESAAGYARRGLEIDPIREMAYLYLMKALALQGKKQEALSQFEQCRKILADELAVEPEDEMLNLREQIRLDSYPPQPRAGAQGRFPARSRFRLPVHLTPLIGRGPQLDRLMRLLFSYRWVTLVGEGGVGKSRLAVSAAEKVADQFPDGVMFLPLADVGVAHAQWGVGHAEDKPAIQAALLRAIAIACDLPLAQDSHDIERLYAALQPRKMLLILDSFEHLSVGADILLELLTCIPQLHILVTTRQAIYFQAGCMMRIDGLPVPQEDSDPQGEDYASVQLFLERITRLYSDYRHTPQNLPWVNRICRLLDGIPLAIELAAPWVNRLPLEAIAHSIENDLDFLSNSMPGLLERHHSMRAVFESSWMLLSPAQKWVLACCSTFKNGFVFDDIFALCQASFQEVEGLVDKNLLIKVEPKHYRMHEILRQFVMEKSLDIQPVEPRPYQEASKPFFGFATLVQ